MSEAVKKALREAVEGYDAARVAAHGGTIERDAMSARNRETITPMIAAAIAAFLCSPGIARMLQEYGAHEVAAAVEQEARDA